MRHSISDLSDTIRDRRTIAPKDFSDRVVQRDMIERILTNATWAPTHGMTQPWRFSVFTGEGRTRLAHFLGEEYTRTTPPEKFLQKKFDNHTKRTLQSSVVIALGMVRDPGGKISDHDELCAVACAVQNMHLSCTAYGLGGFWNTSAVMTGDALKRFLGLEEKDRCLGLFYIGYPAIEWPKSHRKHVPDVAKWVEE